MVEDPSKKGLREPRPERMHQPLPVGYRQGVITAITVVLGFSLLFVRYWGFELPGPWNASAVIAAALLSLALVLQFVALWRSLLVKDDEVTEYSKTLRWFFLSIIVLLISLVISVMAHSHLLL
jgi:4-amino-4-deoxy-L-arabinose transferase-like glycosyltransferase